jgi:hypothetical protein
MQQHKVTLEINELLIGNHDSPIPEALRSLPLEPSGFLNPSAKLNLGCTVAPLLISLWSEPCEECVTQTFAHFTPGLGQSSNLFLSKFATKNVSSLRLPSYY